MIHVSEAAREELMKIKEKQSFKGEPYLRVSVVGGGCSGLSYKLDFTEEKKEDDKIFEKEGVTIVVDPKSYLYVKELTLDYSGGLNGTGFGFNNPNAKQNCGCGSSFSV